MCGEAEFLRNTKLGNGNSKQDDQIKESDTQRLTYRELQKIILKKGVSYIVDRKTRTFIMGPTVKCQKKYQLLSIHAWDKT